MEKFGLKDIEKYNANKNDILKFVCVRIVSIVSDFFCHVHVDICKDFNVLFACVLYFGK